MKTRTRSFYVKKNCKCSACTAKIAKKEKAFRAKSSQFVSGTICEECQVVYN
jgi:predicted RNA-binding protein YlxR (DUF448 family)